MSAKTDKEIIDELRQEVKELKFEKKLNSVLENIRNFSLILINDCKCNQNPSHSKRFRDLNTAYTELKAQELTLKDHSYRSFDNEETNVTISEDINRSDKRLTEPETSGAQNESVVSSSEALKGSEANVRSSTETSEDNEDITSKEATIPVGQNLAVRKTGQSRESGAEIPSNQSFALKITKAIERSCVGGHSISTSPTKSNPLILLFNKTLESQKKSSKRSDGNTCEKALSITSHDIRTTDQTTDYFPVIDISDSDDDPMDTVVDQLCEGPEDPLNNVICNECGKWFDSQLDLSEHKTKDHQKVNRCDECGAEFNNQIDLEIHIEDHKVFHCEQCNEKFVNSYLLVTHLKEHKSKKEKSNQSKEVEAEVIPKVSTDAIPRSSGLTLDSNKVILFCEHCDQMFGTEDGLKEHIEKNHKQSNHCSECQLMFKSAIDLEIHINRMHKKDNIYICKECKQRFDNIELFATHLSDHRTETPLKQSPTPVKPNQSEVKSNSSSIKSNTSSVKSNPSSVKSSPKALNFMDYSNEKMVVNRTSASTLRAFGRSSGSPDGKLECQYCKASFIHRLFRDKDDLELHVNRSHLKNKPYKCDDCNSSFLTKPAFQRHKWLTHKKPAYDCDVCGEIFITKARLDIHMIIHSKDLFSCDVDGCDQQFDNEENLSEHKKTHRVADMNSSYRVIASEGLINTIMVPEDSHQEESGPNKESLSPTKRDESSKTFRCSECEERFLTLTKLKTHESRQHKKKSNLSSCCGTTFTDEKSLTEHMEKGHLIKAFECHVCGFKCRLRETLDRHLSCLHYECGQDGCKQQFITTLQLIAHRQQKHQTSPANSVEKVLTNLQMFSRQFSDQRLSVERNRSQPISPHHFYNTEAKSGPKKTIASTTSTVTKPTVDFSQCDICDHKEVLKSRLEWHRSIEHPKCDWLGCPKRFRSEHYLIKHRKKVHNTDTIYSNRNPVVLLDRCFVPKQSKRSKVLPKIASKIQKIQISQRKAKETAKKRISTDKKSDEKAKQFQCQICPKMLLSEERLFNHSYDRHRIPAYDCNVCHQKLSNKHNLEKHIAMHDKSGDNQTKRLYKCYFKGCDERFETKKYRTSHETQAHERNKSPQFSPKMKIKPKARKSFVTYFNRRRAKPQFACDAEDCEKQFKTKTLLNAHKNKVHRSNDNKKTTTAPSERPSSAPNVKRVRAKGFACKSCDGRLFESLLLLSLHQKRVHQKSTERRAASVAKKSFKAKSSAKAKEILSCGVTNCYHKFNTKDELNRHKAEHEMALRIGLQVSEPMVEPNELESEPTKEVQTEPVVKEEMEDSLEIKSEPKDPKLA